MPSRVLSSKRAARLEALKAELETIAAEKNSALATPRWSVDVGEDGYPRIHATSAVNKHGRTGA